MRKILILATAILVSLGMGVGVSSLAGAVTPPVTTVPVTSADLVASSATPAPGQFSVINNGDGTGAANVVSAPGSSGSLQLSTAGTGSHWTVFNYDHIGTALSAITSLSYTEQSNNTTTTPDLQLEINPGNTTGTDAGVTYSTLTFEPYLQTTPVVSGNFQTWNVTGGAVWGTHLTGAPNAHPLSWSTFLSDYPAATIKGGVGINVGSNWSPMVGNVSNLTIGTSTGTTDYAFGPNIVSVTSLAPITPPTQPGTGHFGVINDGDATGAVGMVNGPGSSGSLQLSTAGPASHWQVFNYDHIGTALSSITSLSYTEQSENATTAPVLQLEINPGNTTGTDAGVTYSTLSFEPYLQTTPVVPGTLQFRNVLDGVVWGSHLSGAPNAAPLSWSAFLTDYPNASIIGGVGVSVGSGWGPMVGNVGSLTIGSLGTTTYAFGPTLSITTSSLPAGTLSVSYPSTALIATGGTMPYKWSISSGALPKGMHLNKRSGTIYGTPNKHDSSGTFNFTVTVVDAKVKVKHMAATQNSSSRQLSINIS